MITIKLPIQITEENKERILKYQKQYSNLLHVYYNRYKEGLSLNLEYFQSNTLKYQLIL